MTFFVFPTEGSGVRRLGLEVPEKHIDKRREFELLLWEDVNHELVPYIYVLYIYSISIYLYSNIVVFFFMEVELIYPSSVFVQTAVDCCFQEIVGAGLPKPAWA